MSHSRDVTMMLNEISLRSGFTINRSGCLFIVIGTMKLNEIKNARQASSPPMLHYALGMDFPIHTRNTWNILIILSKNETKLAL